MLWGLILQGLALAQTFMGYLVDATYHFSVNSTTGQWTLSDFNAVPSDKGNSIIASLLTITHYGLDFVAQLTLLLPAVASNTYSTANGLTMLVVP